MQITPHGQEFQAFAHLERRFDMSRFIGIASGMTLALVLMIPHYQTMAEPVQVLKYTNENLKGGAEFGTPDKVYTREEILKAKPLLWAPAVPAGQENLRSNGFKDEPSVTDETSAPLLSSRWNALASSGVSGWMLTPSHPRTT